MLAEVGVSVKMGKCDIYNLLKYKTYNKKLLF